MPRGGKTPASQRQLRVGEELRHILASLFERDEIHDPDLAGRRITISEVRISPDLRNATLFIVPPIDGENIAPVLAGLKRVKPFLRHVIAKAVDLRIVPDLWFEEDVSFINAGKIEKILARPEVRRDVWGEDTLPGSRNWDEGAVDEDTTPGSAPEGRDDGA